MGWLKGLFGWITGSEQKGLIETVSGGIDKLVFTDQEKGAMFIEYLKASSGQNLARRYLAMMIGAMWVALVVLGVFLKLCGWTEQSDYVFKVLAEVVTEPFTYVMLFYFAAHVVGRSQWGK